MKILFIGGLFPKNSIKEYIKNTKGIFQFAADTLQKSLLQGFKEHCNDLKIITVPFLSNFPKDYKKMFIKKEKFSFFDNEDKNHTSVPFINLKIIDLFSKYYFLKKTLKKEINIKGNDVIIIYGMFTYFLSAIPFKNKNTTCLIVPDFPKMMGGDISKIHVKLYLYFVQKNINKNIYKIDCFVFISKHMIDYLNIPNKPWVVIEGIYDSSSNLVPQNKENLETILYSGTLAKRYGILKLLESFTMINDPNFRLWICGAGDGQKEVEKATEWDSRIKFFGQISHEEVLMLQQRATILVNPRTPDNEFTKYSFPSKTMEYLASGTPTIIYKLEGIPEEYFDYCICCDEKAPNGLYDKIMELSNFSQIQKDIFGKKAKNFIILNKNPLTQTKKVLQLIHEVQENKFLKIN